ncbi:MAG: tetratricopeptide repeat protein, partial [Sphingobacteriales bacterium]
IYSEMKNFDKAIVSYQKALDIDSDFSFVYVFLGNAYKNGGAV